MKRMTTAPDPDDRPPIKRKEYIPPAVRTPDRDDMADVIEEMWPATFTDMAEEAGYSRQHAKNTYDAYFEEQDRQIPPGPNAQELRIAVPDDVDEETYLRGVFEGFRRAREWA